MIYLPNASYSCYVVQNEQIIRAYEQSPRLNSNINYRDYYIRSDYIYKDGVQNFSQYSTLPTCLPRDQITDSVYYRIDFPFILLTFTLLSIWCFHIPLKIFMRLFRRFN